MTKAELIERITDAMVDPWTDNPEDYLSAEPIDIVYATVMLKDLRANEVSADLEPEERLPAEVTPTLVMEAYNCLIRAKKFEVRVQRLAEWITDNDCVCEYCNYYLPDHPDATEVYPTEFIWDEFPFKLIGDISNRNPMYLIKIGQNSPHFDFNSDYCWFDKDKFQLHSTNHPFREGVLDAEAFARFILLDAEAFGYMFDGIIPEEDIPYILGCTKEEYINE